MSYGSHIKMKFLAPLLLGDFKNCLYTPRMSGWEGSKHFRHQRRDGPVNSDLEEGRGVHISSHSPISFHCLECKCKKFDVHSKKRKHKENNSSLLFCIKNIYYLSISVSLRLYIHKTPTYIWCLHLWHLTGIHVKPAPQLFICSEIFEATRVRNHQLSS